MRIVIVGLGLIGGSLAAACRKKFPRAEIVGVTRNPKAAALAKKKKWIDLGFRNLEQAFVGGGLPRPSNDVVGARPSKGEAASPLHLVILCTPVDTLKDYLLQLDRIAPRGTVVTDAGSVKRFLVRWAERRKWKRIYFVGAHPMAGSHERGIHAARPGLFKNSCTFVMPGEKTPPLRLVQNFWRRISGRIAVISPEAHDRLTAEISHLPHLVAALVVRNASSKALHFAATGFLDSTRMVQGDPSIWMPIWLENRTELNRALVRFEKTQAMVKRMLRKKEARALRRFLKRVRTRRIAMG